jgi:hypothetical protein
MAYERMSVEEIVEINKRRREEEHARNVEQAPKPQPRPVEEMSPQEYNERFPQQQIVNLPAPAHGPHGPPEIDGRSEADRLRDPQVRLAALDQRVARLEQIVERLGDAMNRFFGYAGPDSTKDGEVFR